MAAKKSKPAAKPVAKPDQHVSNFMVRMPMHYRPALAALKAKNRRPITVELQIALDRYLASEGIKPPDSST